jgi:hypothetical protein
MAPVWWTPVNAFVRLKSSIRANNPNRLIQILPRQSPRHGILYLLFRPEDLNDYDNWRTV